MKKADHSDAKILIRVYFGSGLGQKPGERSDSAVANGRIMAARHTNSDNHATRPSE